MIDLRAGDLEAAYVPDAGMVCASLRHAGAELLGQRGGLGAYRERGSTFGIPLLHPWANRLSAFEVELLGRRMRLAGSPLVRTEEHGLPIHGLLAASPRWRVLEHAAERVRAALRFDGPELLDAFPFPHVIELDARLAPDALTVRTTVSATGDVAVPVAFGYHPYVALLGIPREQWEVNLPVRRRLLLDGRGLPTGDTEPVEPYRGRIGDRSWDDCFDELVPGEPFAVAGGGRRVEVAFGEGYPVAQVFAPPGKELICFEPMTAPTNALVSGDGLRTVAPGASSTAQFSVRVATV